MIKRFTIMSRSILPFVLTIFGITIAALATNMSLFEWHVSRADIDLSLQPQSGSSSLTTKLGDSLNDGFYMKGGFSLTEPLCFSEYSGITFKLSKADMKIENNALTIEKAITSRMFDLALIILIPLACVIYIWLFKVLYKRPIGETIAFSVIAVISLYFMIDIWKILLYKIGPTFGSTCADFFASYTAEMSKVHYETWIVFGIGVLLELGAFGEMFLQILRAVLGKISSEPI